MGRTTGRNHNVNKSELRNKDRESEPNPNIDGEKAPNVRTESIGTSDVPASRQKEGGGKEEQQQGGDPT
jgi:hypothetical protein